MIREESLHGLRVDPVAHRRIDAAGTDRVDADALGRDVERGALGQSDHAMLGRMIGGASGQADETAERRAVHDRTAVLLLHLDEFMLEEGPDAAQVDGIHAVIAFAGLLGQRAHRAEDTGIVIRHVQAPELGDGERDRRLGQFFVRHVAGQHARLTAGRNDRVHRVAQPGFVSIDQYDGSAGIGVSLCSRRSHAGCGASDEGDPPCKIISGVHGLSSMQRDVPVAHLSRTIGTKRLVAIIGMVL